MPAHLVPFSAPLALAAALAIVVSAGFRPLDWAFVGLLGASCLALGHLDRRYTILAWFAAALTAAMLLYWGASSFARSAALPELAPFLWTTLALGSVFSVGAYSLIWRGPRRAVWSALASSAAVAYFLVGYVLERGHAALSAWPLATRWQGSAQPAPAVPWGVVALALAAVVVLGAAPVYRRRASWQDGDRALAWLATAATTFAALAVPLQVSHGWFAVAWAMEVAAVAWISYELNIPVLRRLAWPLVGLVALCLLTPFVFLNPLGELAVLNWLLYGYGIPIVAFTAAAWYANRAGDERLSALLQWMSIFLGMAMLTLQVRQAFHPGALFAAEAGSVEAATFVTVWLLYGLALLAATRRLPLRSLDRAGIGVAVFGLAAAYVGLVLLANPLFDAARIGTAPLLNWLVYVYGVPALLALAVAHELARRPERRAAAQMVIGAALGLVFVLITTEIRHLFHRGEVRASDAGLAEVGTYVAAWLAYALALLAVDRRRPMPALAAGGAVMAAVGLTAAYVGPVMRADTLLTPESVGTLPLLNGLLYAYGVPALLALAVAHQLARRPERRAAAQIVMGAALGLVFVLISLDVRHLFHNQNLYAGGTGLVEAGTYVVAWQVYGLALLAAARHRPMPALEYGGIAATAVGLTAAFVGPVLGADRLLTPESVGTLPVLNPMLYAYGVPAVLALVAARELARRPALQHAAQAVLGAALVLTFFLISAEIRHVFHPGDMFDSRLGLVEMATYVAAWLLFGLGLLAAARRWPLPALEYGGMTATAIGLCAAYTGPVVASNPLFVAEPVGTLWVFNWLPYVYGLPALILLGVARELGLRPGLRLAASGVAVAALGLVLVLVSLIVRQIFQGPFLNGPGMLTPEIYGYSLAWILLGLALLVAGILRGGALARWASLAVMLLAVVKVFLYDTASLGGLYRVLSFLGLGLSLIALGWLYQRFVFREATL